MTTRKRVQPASEFEELTLERILRKYILPIFLVLGVSLALLFFLL